MGKCCSKVSSDRKSDVEAPAEPAPPFEIVTNPAARDTPVPDPTPELRDCACQTAPVVHKPAPLRPTVPPLMLKGSPPGSGLKLPDVPRTPPRLRIVTPDSPWEVTDGV